MRTLTTVLASAAALLGTSCSWTFVNGPPSVPPEAKPAPETIACTTSYALPMLDGVAGGVVGIPAIRAVGLALWDLGRWMNGDEPKDHDWWTLLLVPSLVGAVTFALSGERGRRLVYACRRAKDMPMEGEDVAIEQGLAAEAAAAAACAASVPEGAPTDVVVADPTLEAVMLCPADGAFPEGKRGGSIVIRGNGDRELGSHRQSQDDIRAEIAAVIRHDPRTASIDGKYYVLRPQCPTLELERAIYISTTDWRMASEIARAAVAVVRDRHLRPQDGVVIAVNRPCGGPSQPQ